MKEQFLNKIKENKNVSVSFVALVILLSSAALMRHEGPIFPQGVKSENTPKAQTAAGSNAGTLSGETTLTVEDQKAGEIAVVRSVSLARKGYVIVHETDNGQFGKIIGSSELLPAGKSADVKISLRDPLRSGEQYIATIHFDNGDGFFLPGTDLPAMSGGDSPTVIKSEFAAK